MTLGSGFGRRRRARRMERRLRELDRLDAQYGLGTMPPTTRSPRVRAQGRNWKAGVTMLVCFGAVVAIIADAALRSASRDAPAIIDGEGQYAFMYTSRDGKSPIGWDPCKPIRIEVNPEGGPPEGDQLIRTAMAHITEASGLKFDLLGTTDSRRFRSDRGGAHSPVIVAWSDERESPELADEVAGYGGPTVTTLNGSRRFTSGAVVLDTASFRDILDSRRSAEAQAIVDHEFGHLVGLKHVRSRGELMYRSSTGRTTWGAGDREGLERLGNVRCG